MYRLLFIIPIFLLCTTLSAQENLPRHPTVDEVAAYLRFHLNEPPEGFISYFWIDDTPLLYTDLNGDGEEDLIARGWLFVAVMLWDGGNYSAPLQIIYTASPESGAWSQVTLDDWTLDGLLDITFDRRVPVQGADFTGNRFERTIISCELLCHVAWDGEIAEYIEVESETGMYLSQAEMTISENENGRVVLDVIVEDFAFNCTHVICTVRGEVIEQDGFQAHSRIGEKIRIRYLWDGLEFLRSDTLTLIDTHIMPPQSRLSAGNARIHYDEQCQLILDDVAIGEAFDCVIDFAQIYWRDNFLILEYAYFSDETLVVFDSSGVEQLRVSGAIRDSRLFGVRMDSENIYSAGERYNNDCPMAQCWFSLNQGISVIPSQIP